MSVRGATWAVMATAVAMVASGTSCVADMPDEQHSGVPELAFPDDVEVVYIVARSPRTISADPADSVSLTPSEPARYVPLDGNDSVLTPDHYADTALPDDPCDCVQSGCLDGWADQNLGCNVCAVFVCGQENPTEHICHFCSLRP